MSKFNLSSKAIMMVIIVFVLFGYGCKKDDPTDLPPPWLGGSNIETLEKRGNYKIFLELMDSAGYRDPITKQLFTLFAPDDEAFKAYFKEAGISSIADLSKEAALQLFTQHILANPRSKYHLIYEFIWNEEQGPTGEYASYFFRKPTLSESLPYNETPKYNETYKDKELLIYTDKKLLPVFSQDLFEDYFGALDGSDYTFMYRNSKWGPNGIQWHNAAIMESDVRTANGFINFIDQVVPPAPNLDEYLSKNQDKYGVFWDMAQRFGDYVSPKTDKAKRQMYKKSYKMIYNIAEEQGPFTGEENKRKGIFTLYCPNDQVFQKYLDEKVLKFYPSLDSVPQITLYYILQTHISQSLGLISKIQKNFYNSFGDPMTVQPSDIDDAFVCSNGVFYNVNRVFEPNVFTTVPGRLFFDPNHSTFLYALNTVGLIGSISRPRVEVTVFAPTNAEMEAYGFRYNASTDKMESHGQDGVWTPITKLENLTLFVQDHICKGKVDLSGEGYIEMDSKNFVYYKNNKIYGGANQQLNESANVLEKIENEKNGILYRIDEPVKTKYEMGKLLVKTPEFSKFTELLVSTGMLDPNAIEQITLDTIPNLKFLQDAIYWTAFIPDNKAMEDAEAKGLIPTDAEALKKFLLYHFVKKKTIFDDGMLEGTFETNMIAETNVLDGVIYAKVDIANSKNNLSVTDHSGQKINIDHKNANRLVSKGVVHKITSVLKY
jgi:uncharacterized surface protein with fasciclin (FAS1) repeats